jgi:hypothetical protein
VEQIRNIPGTGRLPEPKHPGKPQNGQMNLGL